MIGRAITSLLVERGFEVGWLTRNPGKNQKVKEFWWDPSRLEMDEQAIHWPEFVINLAGESIGETHWTREGKNRILESRVQSVQTLVKYLALRKQPLEGFVGVSGIGFYGPSEFPKKETDPAGEDFPARVAETWENEYAQVLPVMAKRKTILRLGVVLSTKGGALPQILLPISLFAGAVLGSGKQPFSWIHLKDATRAFVEALQWDGIFNVAAPGVVDNKVATKLIARIIHRPIILPPVPAFALRLLLGERADLVLSGTNPDLGKLNETGFKPQFPELEGALRNLIEKGI